MYYGEQAVNGLMLLIIEEIPKNHATSPTSTCTKLKTWQNFLRDGLQIAITVTVKANQGANSREI